MNPQVLLPWVELIATGIVIPAVMAFLYKYLESKGIQIEQARKDTYQSALISAVGVLAKGGSPQEALGRVLIGAKDAIKHFKISEAQIARDIDSKKALLTKLPAAPGVNL